MSMAEILDELPRLSITQRRELTHRLIALEPQCDDLQHCDASASSGFALLDEMEADDLARARRT